jgi:hypothetical protein
VQTLEDMLSSCFFFGKGAGKNHSPHVNFAYNNSFQMTIRGHLQALYKSKCGSPLGWNVVGVKGNARTRLGLATARRVAEI